MSSLGSLRSTIELHPQVKKRNCPFSGVVWQLLFLPAQREGDDSFFVPHVDPTIVGSTEVDRAVAVDAEAVKEIRRWVP